jgi:hypothetical protein
VNQRGGSEWEPIKFLLEGDGYSNKTNTASNTCLRLTTQVGQVHAATGVLLNLGTKFQPHRPENAAEHQNSSPLTNTGQTGEHLGSDRSLLVELGDFHRIAPHCSGRRDTLVRPVSARKPQTTKQSYRALNRPKLETTNTGQPQTHPNVHPSKNPTGVAPVRPVRGTGQTGVTWASRDEQHPQVETSKSKPRSPESLHRLEQDFGDSRNTS